MDVSNTPECVLKAAVAVFVSCCERFPGLTVTRSEAPVSTITVPMHQVIDTTCDSPVDLLQIPVTVQYADIPFDFSRIPPSVPGVVLVDSDGKSWLTADFSVLGKQRHDYETN